jgi:hypothetical protein
MPQGRERTKEELYMEAKRLWYQRSLEDEQGFPQSSGGATPLAKAGQGWALLMPCPVHSNQ